MDWNWNYQWGAPKSWICSSCGRSFAPHVSECPYCNNREVIYSSGTSINDRKWWDDYLKETTGSRPNLDVNCVTAKTDPNIKVTAWNSSMLPCEEGKFEQFIKELFDNGNE